MFRFSVGKVLNTTICWKSDSLEDAYSTMQVDIFWCFPSNMLKIQNVNVLLAFHSRAMNQEQSDILCCPQDVNTNQFCPLPFIFEHFPPQTRMLCHAISKQIVYSQHKIILSQQQPSIGPTWIHFKLVRIRHFRCGCSIGMQHPKHAPDRLCKLIFSFLFFSSKIKRQKDAITPQRSRLCACAGCHVTHRSGRRTTGFQDRAKFHIRLWNWMIFLPTIIIIRKCYTPLCVCTFPRYNCAYYVNFSTFVI
jgi:hypothetical protein